ncbi:MAG: glycosyltransferase family 4 protein [Mariniphaga sp.]|nr:glycosyltransferase family 4 protein [Mariniphaga sp.]
MKGVVQKYAEDQLVEVIPVWTDNTFLKPVEKLANPFVKLQGLQDKFVVLYSGTWGLRKGIEKLPLFHKFTTKEYSKNTLY